MRRPCSWISVAEKDESWVWVDEVDGDVAELVLIQESWPPVDDVLVTHEERECSAIGDEESRV